MRTLTTIVTVILLSVAGSATATPPGTPTLHLDAGVGVTTSGGVVTGWADLAGGDNDATAMPGSPTMSLITHSFPAGDLPMVQFHGDGSFMIANEADLNTDEFSVFMVEGDHVNPNGWMIINFEPGSGWEGWGIAMEAAGHYYYLTNDDPYRNDWSAMLPGLDASGNDPGWYTTSFQFLGDHDGMDTGNEIKSMWVENAEEPMTEILNRNGIDQGCTYTIGRTHFQLGGNGGAYFTGEIAELLIYTGQGSADPQLRDDVHAYLYDKYWVPEPATLTLLGLGGLALIRRRRA
jgi:hypothetical protein